MRTLLSALLIVTSQAAAQTVSPVGCDALSASSQNAAAAIDKALDQMQGEAFRQAMPVMPAKVKPAADDVEEARISAVAAMREYTHSLRDFAALIKNCGQ